MQLAVIALEGSTVVSAESRVRYTRSAAPFRNILADSLQTRAAANTTSTTVTHTVQPGENLSRIIRDHLKAVGTSPSNREVYETVAEVARVNHLDNPDRIFPGQVLRLPDRTTTPAEVSEDPLLKTAAKYVAPPAPVTAPSDVPPASADVAPVEDLQTAASAAYFTMPSLATTDNASQGGPADAVRYFVRESAAVAEGPTLTERIHRIFYPKVQNSACSDSPWTALLEQPARLTSEFGMRADPFTGQPAFHPGIDLAVDHGTAIRPVQPGTVTFSGWKSEYGRVVIVQHKDGTESIYGHNAKNLVKAGMDVDEATVLGLSGSTGRSTGPHLHFEVRKNGKAVNPVPYLNRLRASGSK